MWEGPLRPDQSPHKGGSHFRFAQRNGYRSITFGALPGVHGFFPFASTASR
jgi:hypothetical protein